MKKVLLSAVAVGALLGVSSVTASADIACVGPVCWHTTERYEYPPDARVTVHPNDWKAGPNEHYTYREHSGRGYWRGDRWQEW
jgi:hypothetical protein